MVAAFALPLFGFRPFQLGDPATSGEQLRGGEILAKRVFGAFGFGPVDHVGDRVAHVHRDALPSEQPCSLEPPLAEYEPPVGGDADRLQQTPGPAAAARTSSSHSAV
ncbi:Uncharacterised protein [Mycobacterium tuberculosis]|uniref:Uncharacterized protein n=1 Tax=Mycobacterium tuberculosis TaxID=1773 RepID=A0A655AMG8_MYCTX|nr:Uncharacterised protein [Mycobacterium tuberculosis]